MIRKKQILALFICSLVPWTVGNGLTPLLPVYAGRLGADAAIAGYYLAFSNLALAAGALSAGWVSGRFQRRKLPLIIAGLAGIPACLLMGQAGDILSLTVLTVIMWFSGGLGMVLVGILTGLSAGAGERGKIFGILSLTSGLGALIGGLSTGYMVDRWGYPSMFTAVAAFMLLWPLAALFLTEKEANPAQVKASAAKMPGLGRSFFFLASASLLTAVTGFIVLLVRSLSMNDLGFGALEISSTGAMGGLVTLPFPLLVGWLSDRQGRKKFLYLGCLAGLASICILYFSSALWQFWIVIVLQTVSGSINGTIGNALAIDLIPPSSIAKGLSLLSATSWIGGVLGFAGGGLALKSLGVTPTIIIAIILVVAALLLLTPIRPKQPQNTLIPN